MQSEEANAREDKLDQMLDRLEAVSGKFDNEKRLWRTLIVMGVVLFGVTLYNSIETRQAVNGLDEVRRQQGISTCERVNRLRASTRTALSAGEDVIKANQHLIVTILDAAAKREEAAGNKTASRTEFEQVVAAELAKYGQELSEFHSAIEDFRQTNCEAVVPPVKDSAISGRLIG